MSILVDENTKVLVIGITGRHGSFQTKKMLEYGTKIVGGIVPGKGNSYVHGVKVYNTVKEALEEVEADFSIIFVPAKNAKLACLESLENGLNIVVITEGMPIYDTLEVVNYAKKKNLIVIGPNSPGILSVDKCKIGIFPNNIAKKGKIGVVSRSGTLTYEIVSMLSRKNIGQTTIVGIGGDKIVGMNFVEVLEMFEKDDETEKVVLIGEIGGVMEEKAAEYIKAKFSKEVVAYIAGKKAPKEKPMGHAGAIIYGNIGTYESKVNALREAGVKVAENIFDIVKLLQ
ncbi:MAG: succinate--CoA ligase subunit alpha [Candidatus Aenigmatarchaeota archaeon]